MKKLQMLISVLMVFVISSMGLASTKTQAVLLKYGDSSSLIKDESKLVLFQGFDTEDDLEKMKITGSAAQELTLCTDSKYIKNGKGSAALSYKYDEKSNRNYAGVSFDFIKPMQLNKYKGVSIWFYIEPGASKFFTGRSDISLHLGGMRQQWPAVSDGWNQMVWEFDAEDELDMVIDKVAIGFGTILVGAGENTIYLDNFTFVPVDEMPDDDPVQVYNNSKSWSVRYQALEKIAQMESKKALTELIKACGDQSHTVRKYAIKSLLPIAEELGGQAKSTLDKYANHEDYKCRRVVMELISTLDVEGNETFRQWKINHFKKAITDEIFYIRNEAKKYLQHEGYSKESITDLLLGKLKKSSGRAKDLAIISIREMGPVAGDNAIPALLKIVRNGWFADKGARYITRCRALAAVYWIDQTTLKASDWAVGIGLKPGEIEDHILNRCMERLRDSDDPDVEKVLVKKMRSSNPTIRAKALAICSRRKQISNSATIKAIKKYLKDKKWYVRWEADNALEKQLKDYVTIAKSRLKQPKNKKYNYADNVTVKDDGKITTISNGVVEVTFKNGSQEPGPRTLTKNGGPNLIDGDWIYNHFAFKYSKAPSIIERKWLQRLGGAPFSRNVKTGIHKVTEDEVDYKIHFVGSDYEPIEWEYHYVMRKGVSGLYCYIILRNITDKDFSNGFNGQHKVSAVGRFDFFVTTTKNMFDYAYIHDMLKGPTEWEKNDKTEKNAREAYPDIYQSCFRLPDGEVAAKHEWVAGELDDLQLTGYAGGENGGFWLIFPTYEFFDDAQPRLIHSKNRGGCIHPQLDGKYYVKTYTKVTPKWEKVEGPMLLYVNDGENAEDMWIDAKRQSIAETDQWPYKWVDDTKYHQRGTVTGKLIVPDGGDPKGSYIYLGKPNEYTVKPDDYFEWMKEGGAYHYWVKTDENGNFKLDNVIEDTYTLFVWKEDFYGKAKVENVVVKNGKDTNVGNVELVSSDSGEILWQVGEVNGCASEFANGKNYHHWENFMRYGAMFPNDVHFVIGKSDPAKDWNYLHPGTVRGIGKPTTWTIEFNLNKIPQKPVQVTMLFGARYAGQDIYLNGKKIYTIEKMHRGFQHVRTQMYGVLVERRIPVDKQDLKVGKNLLQLTFDRNFAEKDEDKDTHFQNWSGWFVYDFIRMETIE